MNDMHEHLPYLILAQGGGAETVEKKSRFIAALMPVRNEREAVSFIDAVKKKYRDADHNCSAFVIGARGELTRCSDDGEPAGTAGKPMLKVLLDLEIRNAAVVVTRYFGGTLLGTGGLARAYAQAVSEGISACRTAVMRYGAQLEVTADYSLEDRVRRLLGRLELKPDNIEYTDKVRFCLHVPWEKKDRLCEALTETAAGRITIHKLSDKYFVDK